MVLYFGIRTQRVTHTILASLFCALNCSGVLKCKAYPSGEFKITEVRVKVYAIIETGGKQYKVCKGDVIYVEKLNAEGGDDISFDKVLAVGEQGILTFGTPVVEGAVVSGKLVKNDKAKKIIVFKMKSKKGYRRKQGHRQPYSKVEITEIKA